MQVGNTRYMARKKALVCKFIPGMEALKDWSSHGFAVFRNSSWIMILQAYLNGFGSVVIAGYTAAGKGRKPGDPNLLQLWQLPWKCIVDRIMEPAGRTEFVKVFPPV